MAHKKTDTNSASNILLQVLEQWLDDARRHGEDENFFFDEQGFLWLEYAGLSHHSFGEFKCEYKPQDATEKLIEKCKELVGRFQIEAYLTDQKRTIKVYLKDYLDDHARELLIENLAWLANMMLISAMKMHLGECLRQSFEDGVIFAEAALVNQLSNYLKDDASKINADVRPDIKAAVTKAAQERKKTLTKLLKTLPDILAERESGRPKDSSVSNVVRQKRINENWRKFVDAVYEIGDGIAKTDARNLLVQKLGISIRTLNRWLTRDFRFGFNEAIRRAQRQNKGQNNQI